MLDDLAELGQRGARADGRDAVAVDRDGAVTDRRRSDGHDPRRGVDDHDDSRP